MQKNILKRFLLRTIDVVVSYRCGGPVRWDKEPFQKATPTEWRMGWCFMAFLPVGMVVAQTKNLIHLCNR
jgi:hypothetical protein